MVRVLRGQVHQVVDLLRHLQLPVQRQLHRLSQIRWADRILILDGGRLADQGSHEELLARSDLYRRIFGKREADDPPASSGNGAA